MRTAVPLALALAAACTPRATPAPAPDVPPPTHAWPRTPAPSAPSTLAPPHGAHAVAAPRQFALPVVASAATPPALTHVERRGDYQLRQSSLITIAVSPDGAFAASADEMIAVWDLTTGRLVSMVPAGAGSIAVASNGVLVAGWRWPSLTVWDAATGTQRWSTEQRVDRLAFSPDATRLIGSPDDSSSEQVHRIWNVADGALIAEVGARFGNGGACHDAMEGAPTPDGRSLVLARPTGCHDAGNGFVGAQRPSGFSLELVDAAHPGAGMPLATAGTDLRAIAMTPAGDRLAILDERRLIVAEIPSGKPIASLAHGFTDFDYERAPGLAFASDGRHVLIVGRNEVHAWDVVAGKAAWRDRFGSATGVGWPGDVPIAAGDVWIFRRPHDGCVARDMATGAERWQRSRCSEVAAVGDRVVVAAIPTALRVVDAGTGDQRLPPPPPKGPTSVVTSLAVTADGRVAAGTNEHTAWVWDAGGAGRGLPIPGGDTPLVHWNADGRLVVVASTDDGMSVHPFADDGTPLPVVPIAHADRYGGAFAGDRFIATDGEVAATVTFDGESPSALAFSPDGGTLWVCTLLGTLHRFAVQ